MVHSNLVTLLSTTFLVSDTSSLCIFLLFYSNLFKRVSAKCELVRESKLRRAESTTITVYTIVLLNTTLSLMWRQVSRVTTLSLMWRQVSRVQAVEVLETIMCLAENCMSVPPFQVVSSPTFHGHKSLHCAWEQLLRLRVVDSAVFLCSLLNYEYYRKEES
jgi:hypothetical protein